MYNADCAISVARPTEPMDYFYRNAMGDELLFVHEGAGAIETTFGTLPYREGDYLRHSARHDLARAGRQGRAAHARRRGVRPRASSRRKRYRNEYGQLLEHSPYCERDLRAPTELPLHDERGEFQVRIKVNGELMTYTYDYPPARCRRLGRLPLPLRLQHQRLRADHRARPSAAAGPSDLRGAELRRLLVLPAQAGLPSAGDPRALQSQQH